MGGLGGGVGAPQSAKDSERRVEERPGFPGALRALGRQEGHVGAPRYKDSDRRVEERPGFPGALRGWGVWGAMSGPPSP